MANIDTSKMCTRFQEIFRTYKPGVDFLILKENEALTWLDEDGKPKGELEYLSMDFEKMAKGHEGDTYEWNRNSGCYVAFDFATKTYIATMRKDILTTQKDGETSGMFVALRGDMARGPADPAKLAAFKYQKTQDPRLRQEAIEALEHPEKTDKRALKNAFVSLTDKNLPEQEQMADLLSMIGSKRLSPDDRDNALLNLDTLMKSRSVDIMKRGRPFDYECVLEQFLQSFYQKRHLSTEDKDFYAKVFDVLLNTKEGNGAKVDITSHLSERTPPLIGYFGAEEALHPFFEMAVKSAAFDMKNFDGSHFRGVCDGGDEESMEMARILFANGYRPEDDVKIQEAHAADPYDGTLSLWQRDRRVLQAAGKLPQEKTSSPSKKKGPVLRKRGDDHTG